MFRLNSLYCLILIVNPTMKLIYGIPTYARCSSLARMPEKAIDSKHQHTFIRGARTSEEKAQLAGLAVGCLDDQVLGTIPAKVLLGVTFLFF